ncbi:MAG: polysaccharide deacetylase family protein, partial [Anaerolineae bacterium]
LWDLLRAYRARATFFVVGERMASLAEVLRALQEEGHELGCHGWSHRTLWALGPQGLREELTRFRQEAEAGPEGDRGVPCPNLLLGQADGLGPAHPG